MVQEMRPASFRVGLSMRFYLVVVLMLLTLATGMATGLGLAYRLLYVLVLTVALSYLWTRQMLRNLEISVDGRPRRARVGDDIEETITADNQGWLLKYSLEVEDLTDMPGYTGGVVVSLPWYASTSWRIRMHARKRGAYTLGPIRVANTDPFGLFRREKLFGPAESLTVFPRIHDLPGFKVPFADLYGESSARKRTHAVTPYASSVRDYVFGDSLSRVHWNSTARMGRLMSKEFDLGRSSEMWLLIDLHRDVQAGELEESTDEYAATIAASLAQRYLRAEMPVGLVAFGDQRYFLPAETGAGQMDRIMQYLAFSKAEGDTPLEAALPEYEPLWGHNTSLIVITSSPHVDWVAALRELTKRGVRVAVVQVDCNSFGGYPDTSSILDHLYLTGIPTYVVKNGDHIPAALSRPYSGPGALAPQQLGGIGATV